ncbi:thermonuclease family protein [Luteolibacter sp. AS25]|uniref:thermonuclease family protein n=1 Tax=Luteolibacter sp. AS25 TaxID=3135776 RepID=UPI00398B69DF
MPRKRRSKASSILPILIVIAAVAIWIYDTYQARDTSNPRATSAETTPSRQAPAKTSGGVSADQPTRTGGYDTYRNCTLSVDRGNDGDSFRVKLPDGRKEIIRLYFVDSPESAFKTYGGGRNNHERIQQQADAMGRITSAQAVEIGKKAKDFTLNHLGKAPFTLHTAWDSPFNDQRYHGFIQVSYNGKTRFLHELLVEKGYARIHTKGGKLPDGTSERNQEDHLFDLQRTARSNKAGAWGL